MLNRKMFREMKNNFGQFFSVLLLSFMAVMLYAGLESNVVGGNQAREVFHEKTNLADGWMYGEGFTEENLESVRELSFIEEAQLRMSVTGSAPKQNGAQIDIYLETENLVIKPYTAKGEEFNPKNEKGIWLSETFANAWNIQVGDEFTFQYNGVSITKPVLGTIYTPEYEYAVADKDADTDFKNIGYVYMAYKAFPVREYVEHLIEKGTISAEMLAKETDLLNEAVEQLQAYGMGVKDLTQDMLLESVAKMTDDDLFQMLPSTELIFTCKNSNNVMDYEKKIAKAINNNYAVMIDKTSITGIQVLTSELEQHNAFSIVFAVVFVIIALLVIATTMSRMVEQQRTQIGTLNALGLRRGKIIMHYIGFSFIISLIGSILGFILGITFIGQAMVDMFAKWYAVPEWKAGYDITFLVVVILVVASCTLSSYFSCRRLLKVKPSEALRPAPPKEGKNCIFEKLPFWHHLKFEVQYNLRDISRAKLRAVMGIFGTACGMMIVTWVFGCNTMLDNIYEWSFGTIQNFEYELMLEDMNVEEADALKKELDGELIMSEAIEVASVPHATSEEKSTQTLTVIEGKGLYQATDSDMQPLKLTSGEIAITKKLAKKLGLEVGDKVYWHIYTENDWYEAKIGAISRNPDTSGITMLREDFEKTDNEYTPTILATNKDASNYKGESIVAVYNIEELKAAYEENMSMINLLIGVMVAFAIVMVVVVLYNSGNLSFHERIKEFATLKVLGFRSAQIRGLITVQNFWLSLIGIIFGAPFAKPGLQAMLESNGDSFDWPSNIPLYAYFISGAFVLAVSMLVSFMFSKRIKKLDMVEVLKGLE